jgi:hypothetical protein
MATDIYPKSEILNDLIILLNGKGLSGVPVIVLTESTPLENCWSIALKKAQEPRNQSAWFVGSPDELAGMVEREWVSIENSIVVFDCLDYLLHAEFVKRVRGLAPSDAILTLVVHNGILAVFNTQIH